MQIIRFNAFEQANIQLFPQGCVVAMGNFDGVHVAHKEVISAAKHTAQRLGVPAVILTFEPHPRMVLRAEPHSLLITPEEKLRLLEKMRVDVVVIIDFSTQFAAISAEDFITGLLAARLNVKHIVTGYNFYFGHKCKGTPELLAQYAVQLGFGYHQIRQIKCEYLDVSSSMIKQLLNQGLVEMAGHLLGREYTIRGMAQIKPEGTLFMKLPPSLHYPVSGTYLCKIEGEEWQEVYMLGELDVMGNILELDWVDQEGDSSVVLKAAIMKKDKLDLGIKVLQLVHPKREFSNGEHAELQREQDIKDARYAIRMHFAVKK